MAENSAVGWLAVKWKLRCGTSHKSMNVIQYRGGDHWSARYSCSWCSINMTRGLEREKDEFLSDDLFHDVFDSMVFAVPPLCPCFPVFPFMFSTFSLLQTVTKLHEPCWNIVIDNAWGAMLCTVPFSGAVLRLHVILDGIPQFQNINSLKTY